MVDFTEVLYRPCMCGGLGGVSTLNQSLRTIRCPPVFLCNFRILVCWPSCEKASPGSVNKYWRWQSYWDHWSLGVVGVSVITIVSALMELLSFAIVFLAGLVLFYRWGCLCVSGISTFRSSVSSTSFAGLSVLRSDTAIWLSTLKTLGLGVEGRNPRLGFILLVLGIRDPPLTFAMSSHYARFRNVGHLRLARHLTVIVGFFRWVSLFFFNLCRGFSVFTAFCITSFSLFRVYGKCPHVSESIEIWVFMGCSLWLLNLRIVALPVDFGKDFVFACGLVYEEFSYDPTASTSVLRREVLRCSL